MHFFLGALRVNAFHTYQVPSFCLLPSGYLIVIFVHVSVCASVQLELYRPENTKRPQMYRHLHVLHFILYLTFTASLYDGNYACFHMGVVSRLIHGIARQMGASN